MAMCTVPFVILMLEVGMPDRHKTKVLFLKGKRVLVDEDIVPLVSKLWKCNINTTNSCQEHCSFTCEHKWQVVKYPDGDCLEPIVTKHCYNNVWLAFESSTDVERLYNIVAEYDTSFSDESMYGKMSCDRMVQTGQTNYRHSLDGWAFNFVMHNNGAFGHWGRPKINGKRSTFQVWVDDGCTKNDFVIQPQLTFPRKHISYIESRIDLVLKK